MCTLKWDLKMKLTALFVLVCMLQINATTYSQKTRISLDMNNVQLSEVLNRIETISEFKFFVDTQKIDVKREIDIKADKEKIFDILDKLFRGTNITYEVYNKQILLKRVDLKPVDLKSIGPDQSYSESKNYQQVITGTITDENGTPLPGANILEKGTTNGTQADFDGNFSISVEDENALLVVSYVGFGTKEIPLNGQTLISVTLEESAAGLDEVVLVGYGTVKKSDLTGAVTSLSSEDLNDNVAVNVTQQLQGRAAGVQVFQNSNQPGGSSTIQIRGIGSISAGNAPLFVVDGLPISNDGALAGGNIGLAPNPLNTINPNDIKSIEVLKDASATAIYGSRGANGVILITTKSGRQGKLKVSYQGKTSAFSIISTPDILTAEEYQTNLNALLDAGAVNATEAERVGDIVDGGTTWQDLLFKSAVSQEHNISFSGGKDKNTHYTSIGFFSQEGVVKRSKLERFSLRTNLTSESDNFKFGLNSTVTYTLQDIVGAGAGVNNDSGPVNSAFFYDPTVPVYENEETNEFFVSPFMNIENPIALSEGRTVDDATFRLLASTYGEYFITPALSAKLNLGFDYQNSRRDQFLNDFTQAGFALGGEGNVFTGINFNYLAEATLNYNKELGNGHALNLLGGISTQKFFFQSANLGAQNFLSLATETDNLQSGDPLLNTVATSRVENSLLSYIGRANYSFSDKYLITGTLRVDGSSRFGENNKYGYFPSMALGWKLHNEEFLKNSNFFDQLKFRASYGQTGNQDIGNFLSLTTISSGGNVVIPGGAQIGTAQPTRIANPDLKWETTTQFDIGLDWSIWNGRLSGTADYYNRLTSDLLYNLPIPSQTGFTSVVTNIGEVENKGFEVLLETANLTGDFKWNTSFNFATVKNKVLDLGLGENEEGEPIEVQGGSSILRPGETMNAYFGYEILGVWQEGDDFTDAPAGVQPGDWKYNDVNGDNAITVNDRKVLGNSIPGFSWGLTNTFSYKNLSLAVNVFGVHDVQLFNTSLSTTYFPINFRRNRLSEPILNRWTPDNPTNKYPSFLNNTGQGNNGVNSSTVEDAGYVRLQSLTLGYNIPLKETSFISAMNVRLIGENLHTWTNYSGNDPGLSVNAGNTGFRQDYVAYPLSRIFSLNLTVDF
ncbi:TonB-linked outer membrane protein, SusC/RagA family [Arenibacter palladensis]|uniref:TonB-linked outer membrane protein, SusC/RagA family n=2 Tax=Arenibacter palladensis TaxID=237373 RepID=A0A1M5C4Q4_9FLAO|nr:TonB-linked outer membrane protein, SusC/RagA family [Arenibacter palladensis]